MSRVLCVCALWLAVCCSLAFAAADERHFLVRRDKLQSSASTEHRAEGQDYIKSRAWSVLQPTTISDEQFDPTADHAAVNSKDSKTITEKKFYAQIASKKMVRLNDFFKRMSIPSLRIATFNIFMAHMGRDQLMKDIFELDADIIGLQEVLLQWPRNLPDYRSNAMSDALFRDAFKDLVVEYPHVFTCFATELYDQWFGNVILSRYSFTADCIALPPGRGEGRSAIVAVVQTGYGSTHQPLLAREADEVVVVNTHLDVYEPTGATRLMQMQHLMDEIGKKKIDKVVLMGDFNTHRNADFKAFKDDIGQRRVKEIKKKIVEYYCSKQPCEPVVTPKNVDEIMQRIHTVETAIEHPGLDFKDSFDACNLRPPLVSTWSFTRVDYIYLSGPLRKHYVPYRSFTSYVDSSDHLPVVVDLIVESNYLPVYQCKTAERHSELFDDLFKACDADVTARSAALSADPSADPGWIVPVKAALADLVKFVQEENPDMTCESVPASSQVCQAMCKCLLGSDAADVARAIFPKPPPVVENPLRGEPFMLISKKAPGLLLPWSVSERKKILDMSAAHSIPVSLLIDIDSASYPDKDKDKIDILECIRHSFEHTRARVKWLLGSGDKASHFNDKEAAKTSFGNWQKQIQKLLKVESIHAPSLRPADMQKTLSDAKPTPNAQLLKKHFVLRAYLCWLEKTALAVAVAVAKVDVKAAVKKAGKGRLLRIEGVCDADEHSTKVEQLAAINSLAEFVSSTPHLQDQAMVKRLAPHFKYLLGENAGSDESLQGAVSLYTGDAFYRYLNTLIRSSAFPMGRDDYYPPDVSFYSNMFISLVLALKGKHTREKAPESGSLVQQTARTIGRYLASDVKNVYGDIHVDAAFLSSAWMFSTSYSEKHYLSEYLITPLKPEDNAKSRGLWLFENKLEDGNEVLYQPSTVFEVQYIMPRLKRYREFKKAPHDSAFQYVMKEMTDKPLADNSVLEDIYKALR